MSRRFDDCVSGIEIFPRASCYYLRMPSENPMNESDEVAALRAKANAGDASAQVNLGFMYRDGEGVPQDDTQAADQGVAAAQYDLGVNYANGEGVPQDDAEAVRWYRLAESEPQGGQGI